MTIWFIRPGEWFGPPWMLSSSDQGTTSAHHELRAHPTIEEPRPTVFLVKSVIRAV